MTTLERLSTGASENRILTLRVASDEELDELEHALNIRDAEKMRRMKK